MSERSYETLGPAEAGLWNAGRLVFPTNLDLVSDYSPQQVAELHAKGEIQLIDVRQPYEHEAGRIADTPLIELAELTSRAQEIDPDRPVVFYCRSGSRSAMATQAFRGAGYDAHNMAGGLLEWRAAGLPLEPDDGHVAD
jgi:rhodanese-related sulfurtransferase